MRPSFSEAIRSLPLQLGAGGVQVERRCYDPTMMLFMGMWMSLTKKPMKPMMAKPMAVAIAIFWNSAKSEAKK